MVHIRRYWAEDAYCATDPDVQIEIRDGFDRFHDTRNSIAVRGYCLTFCPVAAECTEYAIKMSYEPDGTPTADNARAKGIWGGTSAKQRGKIVQRRKNERTQILRLVEQMQEQSPVLNNHNEGSEDVPA